MTSILFWIGRRSCIIAIERQIEQIAWDMTVIPAVAADGITVIDSAGTIYFVNPAWAAIHGYNTTDELIGRHISTFHTKEQMKNLVADFIEEAKRRGQLAGPVERLRSDGTVFCSQTKMTAARDKEGRTIGLVVFAANTCVHNPDQQHPDRRITDLTTANKQLRNEIIKQKQTEEHLREQLIELTTANQQLQQQIAQFKHTERSGVSPSGTGPMNNIIAIERQIEQIAWDMTVIPAVAADGIAVIDPAGTIYFINPAWAAIHGYNTTDELIGRHISTFHTKEQMKNLVADFIEEAKRRGQLAGPVERLRSDGTVFCSQTKMTAARDKDGGTIGLVVFAADATQHPGKQNLELTAIEKRLQQEIARRKQAQENLAQLQVRLDNINSIVYKHL